MPSSSGKLAAGCWCHETHHDMTAARNASPSGSAATSESRNRTTSSGMKRKSRRSTSSETSGAGNPDSDGILSPGSRHPTRGGAGPGQRRCYPSPPRPHGARDRSPTPISTTRTVHVKKPNQTAKKFPWGSLRPTPRRDGGGPPRSATSRAAERPLVTQWLRIARWLRQPIGITRVYTIEPLIRYQSFNPPSLDARR